MKKKGISLLLSLFAFCFLRAETKTNSVSDSLFLEGKIKYLTGDYTQAIKDFSAVLQFNPRHTESRLLKATAEYNLKMFDAAATDFGKLVEQDSKNFIAWNMLACSEDKQNKIKEATKHFKKSIALNPAYIEAYLNRGLMERRLKQSDKAIADFSAMLTIQPRCENAFYQRGWTKYEKGDSAGACADWTHIEDPDDFENSEKMSSICKENK